MSPFRPILFATSYMGRRRRLGGGKVSYLANSPPLSSVMDLGAKVSSACASRSATGRACLPSGLLMITR
jgi:hypothetical protein